ncbi:complement resistance protein TraT [Endozoicomonas sp. Mp262]|uniref:complement resistance protein TraT n=1 Tax=Endozoicomonas sp. Mp262 TaxID=2919499 RepID=UPI0021D7F0D3
MKLAKLFGTLFLVSMLFGCAATQVALEKKNLDVQTKMSDSIFLDPVASSKRTVFLQVRNTSDKQELNVQQALAKNIESRGYKILDDPDLAHYLLQINVLQAGKTDPSAAKQALASGFGGAVAGVTAGAAMGSSGKGLAAAGLIGGAVELVANSLVKDVTFSVITDIQISEKAKGKVVSSSNHQLKQGNSGTTSIQYSEEGDRKRYQTRIVSTANKMNLTFEEAQAELEKGLAGSISGLL